ncbi:MAG: sulfurtransferase [Pseudomonadales bacterium]|nr:sulfurtransferase [Pseudomonadales bacterium]
MSSSASTHSSQASALVSVDWLAEKIGQPNLVVLDASVPPVVPGFVSINSNGNFSAVPGARRFDYDKEVCKPNSSLPHMMPSAELFQEKVCEIGINRDSLIVVYDDVGIYASPRAWWMFRSMGHEQVFVLDGGLPAWIEAGQGVADAFAANSNDGNFVAAEDESLFCDFEVVLAALDDPSVRILDARSEGRFKGLEPEPRPGVREGHMPNARSLPVRKVVDETKVRSVDELVALFKDLVDDNQKLITSCGSGITACVLTLAAWEAGYRNLSVYDGSWAEWGLPSKLPVVTT